MTLQRRVLTLEAREREQEQKIEEQWEEIERLRGQRKVLLDGETYERETGEEREKEWSAERVSPPALHVCVAKLIGVGRDVWAIKGDSATEWPALEFTCSARVGTCSTIQSAFRPVVEYKSRDRPPHFEVEGGRGGAGRLERMGETGKRSID